MGKAIGIDLGTTYSSMAILKRNIEIIRNDEENQLTRSCVAWMDDKQLVGNNAFNYQKQNPTEVIISVKRLMGNSIKSDNVQKMIANKHFYKYAIIPKSIGTEDTLAIKLGGKEYLPEEISAEILKKLKSDAEKKLNDEVTHAVITVPAYFTEKQKHATLVAAKLAGIKVQKLLPEPTAAAISYGVDASKVGETKSIMVFDFGGGTFDISILSVADGQYLEIAKGGDMWLGGDDIDRILIDFIKKKTEKEYNIASLDKLINALPEKRKYTVEYLLKVRSEELKIKLSAMESAVFDLNDLIQDENGDFLMIEYTVTRNEFEQLISPIIKNTISITKNLLKDINYELDMIDDVVLVGGSSKIPLVISKIKELFGDRVKHSFEPMLEVTKGAAIVAQRMGSDDLTSEISIEDIKEQFRFDEISHSISHDVYVITGENEDETKDLVFQATEPLPSEKNIILKTMYPNQRIAKFIITTDIPNEPMNSPCYVTLKGNYPKETRLYCNLRMDENEIISVGVQVEGEKDVMLFNLSLDNACKQAKLTIDEAISKINSLNLLPEQINSASDIIQKEIEKINSLDPDGSSNDQLFWKTIYEMGELPDRIVKDNLFRNVKEDAKALLNYIDWVLDFYNRLLLITIKSDLVEIRNELKERLYSIDISSFNNIEQEFHITIQKDTLVDYLLYIRYAESKTEDISKKNLLGSYHSKIFNAALNNDDETTKSNLNEAIKLANEILRELGEIDKIKTGVRLQS